MNGALNPNDQWWYDRDPVVFVRAWNAALLEAWNLFDDEYLSHEDKGRAIAAMTMQHE